MELSIFGNMSESVILQMPLHLLVLILSHLKDMRTLGSAILSHSLFYAAYKDDTQGIVRSVIQRQTPACYMRYAANAHEAAHVDRQDKWAVVQLKGWDMREGSLLEWLARWEQEPASTLAAVAASLSRTHSIVKYFSHRFLEDTSNLVSDFYEPLAHHTGTRKPRRTERYRVYRALYRFQIFCNLGFRTEQDLRPSTESAENFGYACRATLFGQFSPWVNEQLACMHDYLEQLLSKSTYQCLFLVEMNTLGT